MKATIEAVKPLEFQGNDGPVKGVEITFTSDGQRKTLSSWIPPVVSAASNWKPGEEHDIEEYVDKKAKPRFRLPNVGGQRGGAPAAWVNTEEGAKWKNDQYLASQREREDASHRRTALMQAVATGPLLPFREDADILDLADRFYAWLTKSAPPAPSARGTEAGTSSGSQRTEPAVAGGADVRATHPDGGDGQGQGDRAEQGKASESPPLPVIANKDDWRKGLSAAQMGSGKEGPVTQAQLKKMAVLANNLGWDDDERHRQAQVESWSELTKDEASHLIEAWQAYEQSRPGAAPGGEGEAQGAASSSSSSTLISSAQQEALLSKYGTAKAVREAFESLFGYGWPGGQHVTADEADRLLEA